MLRKLEDLSSNPENPCKKLGVITRTPLTWEWGRGRRPHGGGGRWIGRKLEKEDNKTVVVSLMPS